VDGLCSTHEEGRSVYSILVGRFEGLGVGERITFGWTLGKQGSLR